ncbi:molybdopterin cofactor-binding domain-containing protein [Pelagicoccus sp. SDUM812002]|uniref:xanthine dehydrogenase family protein molybdopterin-binding subunit n=1 Tax=Pelagicoccus sp. SDUM812002 TaxID=3041266 RepID=UPI00280F9BD8|nr:molybdopterin cofactor-binding domain-containing protein [Pelagicoccus sp. SDUM812002]MDQ8187493.1 molybdopterin-dependent oxidoreductase [Pelagicoccus sp. SDUM812002]
MKTSPVSRRSFLKVSALAGGGLLLSGFWSSKVKGAGLAGVATEGPWFFAQFDTDGSLLLKLSKMEMGQSSPTGVAMLFAEEVGFDWDRVRISQIAFSDGTKAFYESPLGGGTGGSSAVSTLWEPMRKAGAAAREMLIQAAADGWKAPVSDCVADAGWVRHLPSGRAVSYYQLAEAGGRLPVPENPTLKAPKDFKLIGKAKPNAHNREYAKGEAKYGIDVALPGMLFAAIERNPVLGATLVSFDRSEAMKVPGVVGVYDFQGRDPDDTLFRGYRGGVAVVADSTWAAFRGKAALNVNWDEGENGSASIGTLRDRCEKGTFIASEVKNDFGDVDAAFEVNKRRLRAVYETQFQPHASMEPLNTTARWEGDRVEIWTSAQNTSSVAEGVAEAMGLPVGNVRINNLVAGGSFGRRVWLDYVIEAVLLAKRAGWPVKVTWTREDDMRGDYFHPYKRSNWEACLDGDGFIDGVRSDYGVVGSTGFWWVLHWAYLPYGIRNVKVVANLLEEPIQTGAWRSVTEHLQAFPEESFIDEMAFFAGEDAYAFRLKHARRAVAEFEGDDYWRAMTERALRVLESVSGFTDWGSTLPPGRGRGIAMSKFGSTVVCQVAEVEVSGDDFRVVKIDAIVAPGVVVNPQLAENQIEGAIVWGISALKHGKLTFENGRMREGNFDDYPILRMNEVPKMSVHFLEDDGPMGGIGEPGVPAVAPAVCNAIFAACGKRVRSIPVKREELVNA